jgi:flagellar hook-associated protein 3 FlgL
MIGRMSSNQIHQSSLDVILDAQARLQRTQEQLATGKRILSPSDDPVNASRIGAVQTELVRIETYQRNADHIFGDLQVKEDAIASIERLIQRARDLAIQGNNAALSGQDKRAIAAEITGLSDQIFSLSKTQNANGVYIFAGSSVDVAPYENVDGNIIYRGDALFPVVNLGPGITLDTAVNTQSLFGTDTNGNETLFESLASLSGALADQSMPTEDFANTISAVLESLTKGQERATFERASIGVRMNRVEDQVALNDAFNLRLQVSLSGLQDLDYARAISEMNLQMVALEAAQKAYTNTQGLSLFNYL